MSSESRKYPALCTAKRSIFRYDERLQGLQSVGLYGERVQSTHPISSSITPDKPFLYFSSPLLTGGHCFIRVRSFSTSGIAAGRFLLQC